MKIGRDELYPTIQARVKQGGCHWSEKAGDLSK